MHAASRPVPMAGGRTMKINGKHDVDAPVAFVMQVFADFPGWERAALRRGVDVRRTDRLPEPGPGAKWLTTFNFRGKPRIVEVTLVDLDASGRLVVSFSGKSAQGTATLVPLEMSARRTRISASVDIQARTLAARVLIQSMRLARNRVMRKFEQRLAQFGAEIAARYKATGG
jgi:hypothetical protein